MKKYKDIINSFCRKTEDVVDVWVAVDKYDGCGNGYICRITDDDELSVINDLFFEAADYGHFTKVIKNAVTREYNDDLKYSTYPYDYVLDLQVITKGHKHDRIYQLGTISLNGIVSWGMYAEDIDSNGNSINNGFFEMEGISVKEEYEFENLKTTDGIHYSRYIMSWLRMGGNANTMHTAGKFAKWLRESEKLTEEEIQNICKMADTGKMELEKSARKYMEEN